MQKPIPIYVLAWYRPEMTERCLRELAERTQYPHEIHLYVNAAWDQDIEWYLSLSDYYTTIVFDKRNTAVWYPKGVAHAMTCVDTPYYVTNDQDYYPPKLQGECWLTRMIHTMDSNRELAVLGAQIPPQILQHPGEVHPDYVECKAVGNGLRVTRRMCWPQVEFRQELGKFGDDTILCEMMRQKGYKIGFSRGVYCLHGGQCDNWGYTQEQVGKDPRKSGYGTPYTYEYYIESYEPTNPSLRM